MKYCSGKENIVSLGIILDSGISSTIVMGKPTSKFQLNETIITTW